VTRPQNVTRPTKLNLSLPEDVRAWLDIHLWSESEMRVPLGGYQRLILQLIREYRERIEKAKSNDAIS